jgi:hypothetical protein
MPPTGSQKFAVMLCKFSDSRDVQPQPASFFQDLFVNRGTGGLNDYWVDASLGNINLDGTEVLGWKVLDQTNADFLSTRPGRWDKILGAINAFSLDTTKYAGFAAVFNTMVNDGGNQNNGVLVQPVDYNLTFLGHETGHVFGLDHSFDQSDRKIASWSAPGEYWDQYDIMSAMHVYSSGHPRFGPRGPLVNVANLDGMGWLPSSRVWQLSNSNSSDTHQFDLVSLSHPEIPGYLAAHIHGLYLEFRTVEEWDAGLPGATVLIHRLVGANTVVLASNQANWDDQWLPGQMYGPPDIEFAVRGGTRIKVESFDLSAKKARISVIQQAGVPLEVGPGILLSEFRREARSSLY